MRMEMSKRSPAMAAAVCVLLLVLLSGQPQQVAAKSKFCACYEESYASCRRSGVARFFCVPFCANKCSPREAAATTAAAAVNVRDPCLEACAAVKICGLSDPPTHAADAATCARNCNRERSLS
ncbi:unnamed protein product [Alopecurus aequalis]